MSFFSIYLSESCERSCILLNIHTFHFHLLFFYGLINGPAAAGWFQIKSIDYYTEIAEVMGLNPVQAHIVFRLNFF